MTAGGRTSITTAISSYISTVNNYFNTCPIGAQLFIAYDPYSSTSFYTFRSECTVYTECSGGAIYGTLESSTYDTFYQNENYRCITYTLFDNFGDSTGGVTSLTYLTSTTGQQTTTVLYRNQPAKSMCCHYFHSSAFDMADLRPQNSRSDLPNLRRDPEQHSHTLANTLQPNSLPNSNTTTQQWRWLEQHRRSSWQRSRRCRRPRHRRRSNPLDPQTQQAPFPTPRPNPSATPLPLSPHTFAIVQPVILSFADGQAAGNASYVRRTAYVGGSGVCATEHACIVWECVGGWGNGSVWAHGSVARSAADACAYACAYAPICGRTSGGVVGSEVAGALSACRGSLSVAFHKLAVTWIHKVLECNLGCPACTTNCPTPPSIEYDLYCLTKVSFKHRFLQCDEPRP